MMEVIRALNAMLLLSSQAKVASSADPTRKSDTNILANFDILIYSRAQSDDAANTLVSSHMGQFDIANGRSIS
jgi:hypothetical protein